MAAWDCNYRYEHIFRCLPFDKTDRPELEAGNRIIMPQSSLHLIHTLHVTFPLFFKVQSFASGKVTHCGVLEFTAEEGFVHLPRWMMRSLRLEEGGDVLLRDASLSEGLYMKLQPHETAFAELPDPKAVLERALRGYACLSRGDTFVVRHGGRDYYLDVMEVGPGGEAVSLIETDCALEFAPPLDHVEPPRIEVGARGGGAKREVAKESAGKQEFKAFTGKGHVLGGRWLGRAAESSGRSAVASGPVGGGAVAEVKKKEKHDGGKVEFKAFSGRGHILGGPSLDAARVPATASAVVVEGKRKKRKRDSL